MRSTLLTLHDPSLARHYYEAGLWREDTLYSCLARHADSHPDGYAFQDRRHRLTWAAMRVWVDSIAADLHAAGLRSGDRVAVWLPNRANALCPGMIETGMTREVLADQDSKLMKVLKGVPAGRYGQPEDIAQVALFLAGDGAAFMHGAAVIVDGGLTVK